MVPAPNRRDFLHILFGAAGFSRSSTAFAEQHALSAGSAAGANDDRPGQLTTTRLSDHLVHISGAGGNVIVVMGSDGVVMINGGVRERSADLLSVIAEQTSGKKVQALFNMDWHPEHTGSNEPLGK